MVLTVDSSQEQSMSDRVIIVLIIAIAVVVVLLMYRKRLRRFGISADDKGFKADIETNEAAGASEDRSTPGSRPGGVVLRNVNMEGKDNEISVQRGDVEVSDFQQHGEKQKLDIGKNKSPAKP